MQRLHRRTARRLATVTFAVVLAAVALTAAYAAPTANWSNHGNGITNWRYQPNENKISANTVGKLTPAWVDTLAGDISATPAVVDGVVYVPDWGGKVSALNASTGTVIWQTDVAAASGQSGTVVSRTSPAVSGNSVVIGTQKGGRLVSLNKTTGAANWATELDAVEHHPLAIVTQSPTIYNGVVYAGLASVEENGVNCDASLNACHFRGSESAVNLATGQILWTTYTLSKAKQLEGYSGAAVWGSSPTVDVKRNSLYITTGNNYSAPPDVKACALAAGNDQAALAACEPQGNGNYVDAIMSLDLTTGAIKWTNKVQGYDAWTTACLGFPTACPTPAGPDFDFGQGAMLVPSKKGDLVVAGQKSGIMWALNADTGARVWSTLAGPGSSLGGMEWGSATDGTNVYFTIANLGGFNGPITYPMVNPPKGTPATSSSGSWGAIDAATGKIKWQVADPNGAIDIGPPSVANGVVYVGSMAAPPSFSPFPPFPDFSGPSMYALDSGNGKQLWSYASGGSVNAGPAIANGMVFWGSGYSNLGPGLGGFNAKLYAFKLP